MSQPFFDLRSGTLQFLVLQLKLDLLHLKLLDKSLRRYSIALLRGEEPTCPFRESHVRFSVIDTDIFDGQFSFHISPSPSMATPACSVATIQPTFRVAL